MIKSTLYIFSLICFISCGNKKNEIIEYYPNGAIKEKYYLMNDTINGNHTTYYQNGQIKSSVFVENGFREGIYLGYDSLGHISKSGKLIHDRYNSFFKTYYPNGKVKNLTLKYEGKEVYSHNYDLAGNGKTKEVDYIDLITKDTITFGDVYEAKFIVRNNNSEKIYFVQGEIDTSIYFSISDTTKVFNQVNDSAVIFKTNSIKKGRNYWSGIFYKVQIDYDTTLYYPSPIREQFYVK